MTHESELCIEPTRTDATWRGAIIAGVAHHGPRSTKSSEEARAAFRELAPKDPRVSVRPMFGSVAAFVGGNMFMGLVSDELFFRLADKERAELSALGGRALEVMPGRPMREYVTLPDWQTQTEIVRHWASRSLDYALTLPAKK